MLREDKTIRDILARRSIRSFKAEKVEEEKRNIILECACAAPSANGRRPFRLIVIEDRKVLDTLGNVLEQGRIFREAPLAIATCASLTSYPEDSSAWVEDCAAVMENMLIAARALELDGLWFGIYDRHPKEDMIRPILKVPENVEVLAMAIIGYGNEIKEPHSGIDENAVHWNIW